MPIVQTCFLQLSLNLGKTGYQLLKSVLNNALQQSGKTTCKLQSWKKLREYQKSFSPGLKKDTVLTAVKVKLKEGSDNSCTVSPNHV